MQKMKVAAIAAVCLAAGASVAALAQATKPRTAQIVPGGAINQNLGDANYGVCRGIDPSCYHDWPRPKTGEYHVLIFTKTAGPRHADIGTALAPGLNPPLADNNVVQRELPKLLAKEGIKADYTEDLSVLGGLTGYNAVIFYSTSRDNLDDSAKTSLRQYMRKGGGFVAIHNAFGTLYNWPYYEGLLGGANYYDHGPERTGDVVVLDRKDASTKSLPAKFKFKDEWYNLVPFPTHVRYLATVDEKSWDPNEARGGGGGAPPGAARGAPPAGAPAAADGAAPPAGRAGRGGAAPGGAPGGGRAPSVVGEMPGHGSFHPVAWCQYYDGGKAFMTTLGHDAHDFDADDSQFPGAVEFQKLIVGGIKSVIGMEPFCK